MILLYMIDVKGKYQTEIIQFILSGRGGHGIFFYIYTYIEIHIFLARIENVTFDSSHDTNQKTRFMVHQYDFCCESRTKNAFHDS